MAHLSEREAVFSRTDLLTAAIARENRATSGSARWKKSSDELVKDGTLHASDIPVKGDSLTTDRAVADELETIGLMEKGKDASGPVMRSWRVTPAPAPRTPHVRPEGSGEADALDEGPRGRACKATPAPARPRCSTVPACSRRRTTTRMMGLAPSASAAKTLGTEAGMKSETLQRFLARNAGVAEGTANAEQGARDMREAFSQDGPGGRRGVARLHRAGENLLRIANKSAHPRVVLVGDEKQLDAVDAGKPFAQLQRAGMTTARMDEIMRQRDEELKEAVRASLAGEVKTAFGKARRARRGSGTG